MTEQIKKGVTTIIEQLQVELKAEHIEDIRIVLKVEKGQTGAYVFLGSKYHRKLDWNELLNIII